MLKDVLFIRRGRNYICNVEHEHLYVFKQNRI